MARAPNTPDNGENFVHHIVADPKNDPDVMTLNGYPDACPRKVMNASIYPLI